MGDNMHPCKKCVHAIIFPGHIYCKKRDTVVRDGCLILPCGKLKYSRYRNFRDSGDVLEIVTKIPEGEGSRTEARREMYAVFSSTSKQWS